MNYALAFVGFCALIVFHELGHFTAAKLVGMRVEKFSLFFGRPLAKVQKGETEYAVGWIPAGGYVRITGMNPTEEIPEEIAPRAYYRMPVWKRIVVIAAGPLVNIVIAFLILWALLLANGTVTNTPVVSGQDLGQPAAQYLQPNDRVVSVDGVRGDPATIARQVASHRCAGRQVDGCTAATPARVVVERDGRLMTFQITPRYDGRQGIDRARLGFSYEYAERDVPAGEAASLSVTGMWDVTTQHGQNLRQAVQGERARAAQRRRRHRRDAQAGLRLLDRARARDPRADLAVAGDHQPLPVPAARRRPHLLGDRREAAGGRAVPFSVMEKAGAVGFVLVIMLFFIGLSNDIGRIGDGTLGDIPR